MFLSLIVLNLSLNLNLNLKQILKYLIIVNEYKC